MSTEQATPEEEENLTTSQDEEELNNSTHEEEKIPDELLIILNDITDEAAQSTVVRCLDEFESTKWESIFTQPLSNLKNEENVGKPVKLLARVSSITDQYPLQIGEQRYTVLDVILKDKTDVEIECLRIKYSDNGEKISRIFGRSKLAIFKGAIVSIIEDDYSKYKFLVYEIDEIVRAEDLIYVRDEAHPNLEKNHQFQHMVFEGKVFNFIKETLVTELGIKGLESATQLDKTIDFMIYQAFSFGKNQNASMKLHSLVIGAPGSGKKLLSSIAGKINPVAEEVSAADGKVTLAGMIGNVSIKTNKKISQPGYLSLASGGVLCIQDFHEIKQNRNAVLESFAKVMEDGEVIDSTSARTIHTAETSIHLDTNKYSQVYEANTESSLQDIDIPTNVITRFDYIIDIPADAERQWNVMIEMSSNPKTLGSYEEQKGENPSLRWLKRIIAYMITFTPKIEISREIAQYKIEQLEKIRIEYASKMSNINAWQGLFTRIGISIDKYIKPKFVNREFY
jgi:hypothetical protein